MAANDKPALSFDQFVQENRKKKAAQDLAQKLLGSGRRSSAPPTGPKGLSGSLASRVGVTKRTSSLPRSRDAQPSTANSRGTRPGALLNRFLSDHPDDRAPSRPSSTRPELGSRSNSGVVNGSSSGGLSIRGAASTPAPVAVVAQNFAPGTTAADIESVMLKVGGEMSSCRLLASTPTVIAEMVFVDPSGADNVIEQFNGKKADGRSLYVYRREDGGARRAFPTSAPVDPIPISSDEDAMMVDEAAEAREREANDRVREERRREQRPREREREVFPAGPRGYGREREEYYDRGRYGEGRYGGYGGGGGGYGSRGAGGGRYDGRDRGYGAGGRGWR